MKNFKEVLKESLNANKIIKEADEATIDMNKAMKEFESELSKMLHKSITLTKVEDYSNGGAVYKSGNLKNDVPDFLKFMFNELVIKVGVTPYQGHLIANVDYDYKHPHGHNGYELARGDYFNGKWQIKQW